MQWKWAETHLKASEGSKSHTGQKPVLGLGKWGQDHVRRQDPWETVGPLLELKYSPCLGTLFPYRNPTERHEGHFLESGGEREKERPWLWFQGPLLGLIRVLLPPLHRGQRLQSYKSWMRYYFGQKSKSEHFLEELDSSLWRFQSSAHMTSRSKVSFDFVLCSIVSMSSSTRVWNLLDIWLLKKFSGPIPTTTVLCAFWAVSKCLQREQPKLKYLE